MSFLKDWGLALTVGFLVLLYAALIEAAIAKARRK
jgi:hypothetical protein